jgi:hypothetical protein
MVIAGALLLHGLAHAIALAGLVAQSVAGPADSRITVRSWFFPALQPKASAWLAVPLWAGSTLAFLFAAISFWGLVGWGAAWRQIAVAGALASTLGVAVFTGQWPGSPNPRRSQLNTSVGLAMNAVILITQLWLGWPPLAIFGK